MGPLFRIGSRLGVGADQLGQRRGAAHGLAQIAQGAAAAHFRQFPGLVGQGHRVGELPEKAVDSQAQVNGGARGVVAAGKGGAGGLRVAVAEIGLGGVRGQIDGADVGGGQGAQFIVLADAVLIQVAPDAHIGKARVFGVEDLIVVAVEIAQGVEAVRGFGAVGFHRIDTEQLSTVIDGAVAVAVQHQETVVGIDPAGAGFDAVAVVVE